jgi:type I restriction enzyme, R subunit
LQLFVNIYKNTGLFMTESEWQTRKKRIDTRLKNLPQPWKIIKYKEGLNTASLHASAVEEYPTGNGPADYALFVHGQLLGIIEAKKVTVNPQNVLEQAKRYARGATDGPGLWQGFRVPFIFATNGEIIHFADVRRENYFSRKLFDFHTPDALHEFFTKNGQYEWFTARPVEEIEKLRPYQIKAIEKTEQAIARGKRSFLLAMATGTGKTYTTVAQIYRLLKSGMARRVLFLVDRRALAAQAVRTFAAFNTPQGSKFDQEYEVYSQRFRREDFEEDEPFNPKVLPNEYLTNPQDSHTFVYVSTIQRMTINLFGYENAFPQSGTDADIEEDAEKLDIPIHAFDVIIADECHRGYTAKETATWRSVMEYFDAVRIGLTATPAAHTLSLFSEVVFRYTTDEAIADGWLVDYDAVKIHSGVRMKGAFLKEGEHVGIIDTETGEETYDELEDERQFDASEVEKKITAPESNLKIIQEIAQYAYSHEKETGHFPKILIFADNEI